MEILTQIQEQLQQHPGTGSSIVLAQALAAACHESYGVSLLAAASVLDSSNVRLLQRLANIVREPDYDNEDMCDTMIWLMDSQYAATLHRLA